MSNLSFEQILCSYSHQDLGLMLLTRGVTPNPINISLKMAFSQIVPRSGFTPDQLHLIKTAHDQYPCIHPRDGGGLRPEFIKILSDVKDWERRIVLTDPKGRGDYHDIAKLGTWSFAVPRFKDLYPMTVAEMDLLAATVPTSWTAYKLDAWIRYFQQFYACGDPIDIPRSIVDFINGDDTISPPSRTVKGRTYERFVFDCFVDGLSYRRLTILSNYDMSYRTDSWSVWDIKHCRHYDGPIHQFCTRWGLQEWMREEAFALRKSRPAISLSLGFIENLPLNHVLTLSDFTPHPLLFQTIFGTGLPVVIESVKMSPDCIDVHIDAPCDRSFLLTLGEAEDFIVTETPGCSQELISVDVPAPSSETHCISPVGHTFSFRSPLFTAAQQAFIARHFLLPGLTMCYDLNYFTSWGHPDEDHPQVWWANGIWLVRNGSSGQKSCCSECHDYLFSPKFVWDTLMVEARRSYSPFCHHLGPHFLCFKRPDGLTRTYELTTSTLLDRAFVTDFIIVPDSLLRRPSYSIVRSLPFVPWSVRGGVDNQYKLLSLLNMTDHTLWTSDLIPIGFPLFHFDGDSAGLVVPRRGFSSYCSFPLFHGMRLSWSKLYTSYVVCFGGSGAIGLVPMAPDLFLCLSQCSLPWDVGKVIFYLVMFDFCTYCRTLDDSDDYSDD